MANYRLMPWILSLIMVMLGSYFILAFAFNFVYQTNPSSEIFDSKYGLNSSINTMGDSLSGFTDIANTVKTKLADSQPKPLDFVFLIFYGAFEIPLTFLQFVWGSINTFVDIVFVKTLGVIGEVAGFNPVLGIVALVSGIIFSALVITIVFLIIKNIRSGD